jgi:GH15 family glucan-1,4-alpha-glucosidase
MPPEPQEALVSGDRYPPIDDYGFIADCHSAALVSGTGSIDWCCMPRVDQESIFGRLLDWERGGSFRVAPTGDARVERGYLDGTLVLETTFATNSGRARLLDCFVMREGGREDPARQIIRIAEGIEGDVEFELEIAPRFSYGEVPPWVRRRDDGGFALFGSDDALLVSADLDLEANETGLTGSFSVSEGERIRLSIAYVRPEDLDRDPGEVPSAEELDARLDGTVAWWRTWAGKGTDLAHAAPLLRSATVLKGLIQARTGAMAAAPTTSLPEVQGGSRNWDYRYSWIRDSTWAMRSLYQVGHEQEADGFRRFVERTTAGHVDALQIAYGVGGELRLPEEELPLDGYRGARPVRVGNRASGQEQNDVYGELLLLAWLWHREGHRADDHYWGFLVEVVERAIERWPDPDRGLWEERGEPEHHVHSKALCWSAVDRGLRLAEAEGREVPRERWEAARDEMRRVIETRGYDEERGVFVRVFDTGDLDGALLLLPQVGFVDWDDERMVRTADAIRDELDAEGLLYRARWEDPEDQEGAFLPCSFWLAECLARQGRLDEAEEVFERTAATANDVGLFGEEYDTRTGETLGNFPQALTHLSHISAGLAIARARRGSGPPDAGHPRRGMNGRWEDR